MPPARRARIVSARASRYAKDVMGNKETSIAGETIDRGSEQQAGAAHAKLGLAEIAPNMQIVAEVGAVTRAWQAAMDAQLREHGLTHVRWITLWRIAESKTELNQTDLARRVGIESSTLVRQLDALEERGLIERVVDKDRRARLIRMTPAAEPVIQLIKGIALDLGQEVMAGVDEALVAQCAELLHMMRERLRDRATCVPESGGD